MRGQIVGADGRCPPLEYFLRFTNAWCPPVDLYRGDGKFGAPGRWHPSSEGAATPQPEEEGIQ